MMDEFAGDEWCVEKASYRGKILAILFLARNDIRKTTHEPHKTCSHNL